MPPQDLGEIQGGYNWGSAHAINAREFDGAGKGVAKGTAKGAAGHSLSNTGSRIQANKGRNLAVKV